jgi:hypothetical protein
MVVVADRGHLTQQNATFVTFARFRQLRQCLPAVAGRQVGEMVQTINSLSRGKVTLPRAAVIAEASLAICASVARRNNE